MANVAPVFPNGDLDKPGLLAALPGSFWTELFSDKDITRALLSGLALAYQQAYSNFLEDVDTLSRQTVPVWHRQLWMPITLRDSQMNRSDASLPRYGDDLTYGQAGVYYGVPLTREGVFVFPLGAPGLRGITAITDGITSARLALVNGVDFVFDTQAGALRLFANPFESEAIPDIRYDAEGMPVRELKLWAYCSDVDDDRLWRNFGYVLGLRFQSSTSYRRMINAVWDSHAAGSSYGALKELVAAAMGVPLVTRSGTVELVARDTHRWHVVTEDVVYSYPIAATPTVAPGDRLVPGDCPVSTLRIDDLAGGIPADIEFPGLLLDRGFLGDGYQSALFFANKQVPLEYVGVDGTSAEVRFEVSGLAADVELWWERVRERGTDAGRTLADVLDTRQVRNGPPLPQHLPQQVNPFRIVAELMASNLILVSLRAGESAADGPGATALWTLRKVLPPHVTCVTLIRLDAEADRATLTDSAPDSPAFGAGVEVADESFSVEEFIPVAYVVPDI